jgi:hypothetical protein
MRKIKTDYGALDIYKKYVKTTKNPKNLTRKQFTAIIKKFYGKIIEGMIIKSVEFNLPHRLGNVRIKKSKVKIKLGKDGNLDKTRLAPDWNACKKLWAKEYPDKTWEEITAIKGKPMIYHTNRHTDGFRHKWYWDKSTCLARNSSAYTLNICRAADRRLAKALKDENLVLDYSIY